MKDPKKVAMGKRSKSQGSAFELRVRKDLEEKGWIVDKWSNNVEFNSSQVLKGKDKDKVKLDEVSPPKAGPLGNLIPAKPKMRFNPKTRSMSVINISSGFPDFIAYRLREFNDSGLSLFEVIGVESKMTGILDKEEKAKCKWMLDNSIFGKILIAKKFKEKNKVKVIYNNFENKVEVFL